MTPPLDRLALQLSSLIRVREHLARCAVNGCEPALISTLYAVLDVHEPVHDVDTDHYACVECSSSDHHTRYPCRTVQAVTSRLDG